MTGGFSPAAPPRGSLGLAAVAGEACEDVVSDGHQVLQDTGVLMTSTVDTIPVEARKHRPLVKVSVYPPSAAFPWAVREVGGTWVVRALRSPLNVPPWQRETPG